MRSSKAENLAQLPQLAQPPYDACASVAQPVAQLTQPLTTTPKDEKKERMRKEMPAAAEIVDWLRAELGQRAADAIVRKGLQGRGGFWVRETGPDGVVREIGSR